MNQYTLKRSARARNIRLAVRPGGAVVLTVPQSVSVSTIERFLAKHTEWIQKATKRMGRLKPLPVAGRKAYLMHRETARAFVHERILHWNAQYGFTHGRVAIKNTRSLWGSCSRKGNLNFSYAIIHLPRELADYIIVHELCHLREHNHSAAFWALVEKTQSDYVRLRKELRTYALSR